MLKRIQVGILEDHQTIVDGYLYRLGLHPHIEIAGVASYGEELDRLTKENHLDLLILDVSVPTSQDNSNPYPILHQIPRLLTEHPNLAILVITMYNNQTLIQAVMEAGASGYILKDDRQSLLKLGEIVTSIANDGGIHFSRQSYDLIAGKRGDGDPSLTPRQQEVLSLCAAYPNTKTADIAEKLHVAPSTVRNLLSDAYMRLNVSNRQAAVSKARRLGLITPYQPSLDT